MVDMSFRLIALFIVLLTILFFSYDSYSYGISLKRMPILMTNPVLVIQAHYLITGDRLEVRKSCPEITEFRADSPYAEYFDIPAKEWRDCISAISPSFIVKDACLSSQAQAELLLEGVNSKNEIILGLEKYGIRFDPVSTYGQYENFADDNLCTRTVLEYASGKKIEINLRPSKILGSQRLSGAMSDITSSELTEIAKGNAAPDAKLSSFLVLAGVFIFIIVIYTVYLQLRGGERQEE
jgi:hypothetical protein